MPDEANRAPRAEYTLEAVAACEKSLRTLIAKIGPWGSQLILIGGMAPKYLVGTVPRDLPPHIGTTDLDDVVGVAVETDDDAAYRTLQKTRTTGSPAAKIQSDTAQYAAPTGQVNASGRVNVTPPIYRGSGRRTCRAAVSRGGSKGLSWPAAVGE